MALVPRVAPLILIPKRFERQIKLSPIPNDTPVDSQGSWHSPIPHQLIELGWAHSDIKSRLHSREATAGPIRTVCGSVHASPLADAGRAHRRQLVCQAIAWGRMTSTTPTMTATSWKSAFHL